MPSPHESGRCPEVIEACKAIAVLQERQESEHEMLTEVRTDVKAILAATSGGSGALSLIRHLAPWIAVAIMIVALVMR